MNKKSLSSVLRLLIGSLLWDGACPLLSLPVGSRGRQSRDQAGTKWRDQSRLSKRRPPERFNGNSATPSHFPPLQWFLLFHWFLLRPARWKDTGLNSVHTVCVCTKVSVAFCMSLTLGFPEYFCHFLKKYFYILTLENILHFQYFSDWARETIKQHLMR